MFLGLGDLQQLRIVYGIEADRISNSKALKLRLGAHSGNRFDPTIAICVIGGSEATCTSARIR